MRKKMGLSPDKGGAKPAPSTAIDKDDKYKKGGKVKGKKGK